MSCSIVSTMDVIGIESLYPAYFTAGESAGSELWNTDRQFQKGYSYLIKAASGKGKSSFCNFLYGARRDYTGVIRFDGQDTRTLDLKEWRTLRQTSLNLMYQDLELFPRLTVMENIAIKNRLTKFFPSGQTEDLLERLGISSKAGSLVSTLSLGERQRVAFIRSLAQPLDFLLMDEPVSHLDSGNAEIIAGIVAEEKKRRGFAVIVTSLGVALPLDYDEQINI